MTEKLDQPHVMFGSGTYRHTAVFHRKINALQQTHQTTVQRFTRYRGENDGSYYYRRNVALKRIREKLVIKRWADVLNVRYFEFVGHIGRLKALDPTRLTVAVLS